MQDLPTPDTPSQAGPSSSERARSRSLALFGMLLAFLLGAGLVVWTAVTGELARILPEMTPPPPVPRPSSASAPPPPRRTAMSPESQEQIGTVEGRIALIEDRLARIDFATRASSGNASRAEALLVSFAARRLVDRGEPLGFVADQLRLRFADAQPRAVQTLIDFAQRPVTIDQLGARLEALSPELADVTGKESFWTRARRGVTSLFIVHSDDSALVTPSARIDRARLMLTARRIGNAVEEVERLPGAQAADTWIADARRYETAQRALDLIETTAMLEANRLRDAGGQPVMDANPLAAPTAEPTATVPLDPYGSATDAP